MKRIYYLLCIFALLLLSCTAPNTAPATSTKAVGHHILTLLYNQPVNGYDVRVQLLPMAVRQGFLLGPAILTFTNTRDSSTFSLASNYFPVLSILVPIDYLDADSTVIRRVRTDTLRLRYPANSSDPFSTEVPFFFADITFDQRPELLLQEAFQGQRGVHIMKAYEFDDGLNAPAPSLLTTSPFIELDGLSSIDYAGHTLTIENSGGTCSSREDIYRLQPTTSKVEVRWLGLSEIFDHEYDEHFCYELHYKVNPQTGQKILLSRIATKI